MAAALEPGMWVEINSPGDEGHGQVRQVEALFADDVECGKCGGTTGVLLTGDLLQCDEVGWFASWCVCELRPIYRPCADFIEALKAPPITAPVHEREDA